MRCCGRCSPLPRYVLADIPVQGSPCSSKQPGMLLCNTKVHPFGGGIMFTIFCSPSLACSVSGVVVGVGVDVALIDAYSHLLQVALRVDYRRKRPIFVGKGQGGSVVLQHGGCFSALRTCAAIPFRHLCSTRQASVDVPNAATAFKTHVV